MTTSNKKIIRILGGMGSKATVYLYIQILRFTPAQMDQDHIPTIIYSNTQIPYRTESILSENHSEIVRALVKSAKVLENCGVDFILIPCNTAHFYFEEIKKNVNIPILNMVNLSPSKLKTDLSQGQKSTKSIVVGLLASNGTVKSRIYTNSGNLIGIDFITPSTEIQEEIIKIIYTIKGRGVSLSLKAKLLEIIRKFRDAYQVKWVILGCTELPLLFNSFEDLQNNYFFDPMYI